MQTNRTFLSDQLEFSMDILDSYMASLEVSLRFHLNLQEKCNFDEILSLALPAGLSSSKIRIQGKLGKGRGR